MVLGGHISNVKKYRLANRLLGTSNASKKKKEKKKNKSREKKGEKVT